MPAFLNPPLSERVARTALIFRCHAQILEGEGRGPTLHQLRPEREAMRRDGTLREFNAVCKARRAAAIAAGQGFMGFGVAMARLKRALIPRLMSRSAGPMPSLFDQVFR